ncbi:helix-turn-helix transcriptional regulator [Haloechinothrix sp. LS1_15]|uniref:helix-turn-helix domain-containing protein n=1 Tax=Haloechinothrix sp. LS1_15 TaxID=2652248 RepID=UPI0029465EAA|nr:helix-turn-helix transcriptional regulator [Haloechinothrix sp. LS1_15]MDV6014681.1 helix-turn-helix domain-containing protein [Haloechinothrix sp. LS1_15]
MTATTGTPRARALAAALRQARETASLSVRELARRLNIQHSTISYWETGRRVPRPEDVGGYLAAVGVSGEERERILELSRDASKTDWLTVGIPGASQQLEGVMECERTATTITEWIPWMIPGLLQTTEYAREVIGPDQGLLTLRLARRDVLTRRDPVRFHAIIGEPALRQVIGGREVMAHQLSNLLDVPRNVTVQVVPMGNGMHPGLAGPFILYEFEHSPAIVHVEHWASSAFVYNDHDVEDYRKAADTLRDEAAMSPADSAELIASAVRELETTR